MEETTEILRRKNEQWVSAKSSKAFGKKVDLQKIERRQFQTEMEVTGRMSIVENDDWLATRLKAVSSEDMNRELGKIKDDQSKLRTIFDLVNLVNSQSKTLLPTPWLL